MESIITSRSHIFDRKLQMDTETISEFLSRETDGGRIDSKVLFDNIYQQDHAPAHKIKKVHRWLQENVPFHSPILLSRHREEWCFSEKFDDIGLIERVWEICCQVVLKQPAPTRISDVTRRIRKAHVSTTVDTLTKLTHELFARLQEIYKQKG